jgi:hypothetical protein
VGGVNTYVYALANPLYFFDSLGLDYGSKEAAGKAGVCAIICLSILSNREFSGPICKKRGSKRYMYGPPVAGDGGAAPWPDRSECPPGYDTLVGVYHTHGQWAPLKDEYDPVDRNLNFSYRGDDPSDIKGADDDNVINVLGDTSCFVHVYYPGSYNPKASDPERAKQRAGEIIGRCSCPCDLCNK